MTVNGRNYVCSGTLYDDIGDYFKTNTEVKVQVMFLFHVFSIICAMTTIILAAIALCKEMVKNFIYMIVTIVLAAMTSVDLLVAASMKSNLYVIWLNLKGVKEEIERDAEYRGNAMSSKLQLAMFWIAFLIATACLICLIIATIYAPSGTVKKQRPKTRRKKR